MIFFYLLLDTLFGVTPTQSEMCRTTKLSLCYMKPCAVCALKAHTSKLGFDKRLPWKAMKMIYNP